MSKIKTRKTIFLSYDAGFAGGPFDLTEEFADPGFVLNFVQRENLNGISLTPGMFLRLNQLLKKKKIPTIVKVNGLTSLVSKENLEQCAPILSDLNGIIKSLQLGALGFNLYLGSRSETKCLKDLGAVISLAKKNFKSVLVWPFVFSSSTFWHHNETLRIAYGVRAAMEMGADAAVLSWPETRHHFDIIAKMTPNFPLFLSEAALDKTEKIEDALTIIKDFFAEGGKGIFLNPKTIEALGKEEFINKIKQIIKR